MTLFVTGYSTSAVTMFRIFVSRRCSSRPSGPSVFQYASATIPTRAIEPSRFTSSAGGPPARLTDDFRKRAVYGYVSRRQLDGYLALFDFPNPNNTSEQRGETNVPLQRLFFMNSELITREAEALAGRLKGADPDKIREAYQRLYGRPASDAELKLGLDFLKESSWPQYAQALLSANEFSFVN